MVELWRWVMVASKRLRIRGHFLCTTLAGFTCCCRTFYQLVTARLYTIGLSTV